MPSEVSYRVILQPLTDGGFLASVPALPDLQSYGDTLAEAKARITEAIEGVITAAGDLVPPDFSEDPVVDVVAVRLDRH